MHLNNMYFKELESSLKNYIHTERLIDDLKDHLDDSGTNDVEKALGSSREIKHAVSRHNRERFFWVFIGIFALMLLIEIIGVLLLPSMSEQISENEFVINMQITFILEVAVQIIGFPVLVGYILGKKFGVKPFQVFKYYFLANFIARMIMMLIIFFPYGMATSADTGFFGGGFTSIVALLVVNAAVSAAIAAGSTSISLRKFKNPLTA